MQPTEIGLGASANDSSLLKLSYDFGGTNNNGNVLSQRIVVSGSAVLDVTQSYGYDGLNRLSSASEGTGWTQTYDYDRYGNRAVRTGSYMPQPQLTPQSPSPTDLSAFNANTNRIALTGFGYDVSGNLTSDPTTNANAMAYDSENHLTSYTKSGVTTGYSYDGDGRRVKKTDGTGTTVFVYNVAGQLIAEYHSDPVPTPQGGGGTSYLTTDHLGSTRVVTKPDGSVKARYDYLPFGEQIGTAISGRGSVTGYNGADSTRQKFTQKERDTESGLDYFRARYYSSTQGRFASVDPENAGSISDDPQSWNGYAYARSNPLLFTDPDGREYRISGPNGSGTLFDDQFFQQRAYFESLGFVFTGNRNFYERGVVISPDGVVVLTYQQISIDDQFAKFRLEMARRAPAMLRLIDIAANVTLTPIMIMSGTAVMRGGAVVLDLAEAANTARLLLRSGQLLETTIQTSQGPVDVLAEIVVQGDKLVLKDLVIYGRNAEPLTGLTREMLGALSKVKEVARAAGFKELQILAKRAATSTSANPGHIVDVTIKL